MESSWTLKLGDYLGQLETANLMPPINAVFVDGPEGREVLILETPDALDARDRDRVDAILAAVPHEIRHRPYTLDGQRLGVDYLPEHDDLT